MQAADQRMPLGSLFARTLSEVANLVRTELRLARTETDEKIGVFASGGGQIGAAAGLVLAGAILLLIGIVEWLATLGLPDRWGFVLLGGLVAAIGAALLWNGVNNIKRSVPHRIAEQLEEDLDLIKEELR